MKLIKGITVTLYDKVQIGADEFNCPVYREEPIEVENVLVSPVSSTDVIDQLNLYGKRAVYTLAIPKGDTHNWKDRRVEFFGESWKTFGLPISGIEENIPLDWNTKVMVERYE